MKKLFMSVVMLLSMVSFAQAYSVQYDKDGAGAGGLQEYDIFQLLAYSDIKTNQDFGIPGNFTESFTMRVTEGVKEQPGPDIYTSFDNTFADISLQGTYYSDSDIRFTGGSATMYRGADTIANFDFSSALISNLEGSLLGTSDLGMLIDFTFLFSYVNPLYWGTTEQDLVGQKWLLALVGGRIDQDGLEITDNGYIISWTTPGSRMKFNAVPEPSTILLLGSGFLGVALFGRRKFFKKS